MSWEASPTEYVHPGTLQDRASTTHDTSQPPPSFTDERDHGRLSGEADLALSFLPLQKESTPTGCLTPKNVWASFLRLPFQPNMNLPKMIHFQNLWVTYQLVKEFAQLFLNGGLWPLVRSQETGQLRMLGRVQVIRVCPQDKLDLLDSWGWP